LQQARDEITWQKKSGNIRKPGTPSQVKIDDECKCGITSLVKIAVTKIWNYTLSGRKVAISKILEPLSK
jgi:hypothetical protein